VVNSQDAFRFPVGYNESATFSSDGTTWLILFNSGGNYAPISWGGLIYIFKIAQNNSLGVLNSNLIPQKIGIAAPPPNNGVYTDNPYFPSDNPYGFSPQNYYNCIDNNCTVVWYEYSVTSGTFNVSLAFTFRVYETTLVGIVPSDEATIYFNSTIAVP